MGSETGILFLASSGLEADGMNEIVQVIEPKMQMTRVEHEMH